MDPKLVEAYRFFRAHAGGVVGRSAAVALSLAKAEQWAENMGWYYHEHDAPDGARICIRWEYSQERYEDVYGEPPPKEAEILDCVVYVDGEPIANLGMIDVMSPSFTYGVPRDPTIRVVQAELLSEAMAVITDRVDTAETRTCND